MPRIKPLFSLTPNSYQSPLSERWVVSLRGTGEDGNPTTIVLQYGSDEEKEGLREKVLTLNSIIKATFKGV